MIDSRCSGSPGKRSVLELASPGIAVSPCHRVAQEREAVENRGAIAMQQLGNGDIPTLWLQRGGVSSDIETDDCDAQD